MDKELVYRLSMEGKTARQISEVLGESYTAVRTCIQRERRKRGTVRDKSGKQVITNNFNFNNGEISIVENSIEKLTASEIMRSKGLNEEEWEIVSFTQNTWEQQTKDGDSIELCQSKLTVKPAKAPMLSVEDIENFFKEHDFSNRVTYKPIKYNKKGEILEIDVADLHCGLLAWRYEAGSDYDLNICADRFLASIKDIVDRSEGKKFKQIYFCTLGDVLHVDNMASTTTKGTVQQTDGRITKIIEFAYDTMNTALDMLRGLNASITYIYLCGNHDTAMGFCLAKMLQMTNPDIKFDISPNPQKAIHFGKCLVGLTHGDMPKQNKGQWLIHDYRKEFGESDFVEEHSGHIHTEEVKVYNGIPVRSVLAQCGNSYWEHQQGYRSKRGLQCFVWNEDTGLRETWYYFIEEKSTRKI